eukprot:g7708.t1
MGPEQSSRDWIADCRARLAARLILILTFQSRENFNTLLTIDIQVEKSSVVPLNTFFLINIRSGFKNGQQAIAVS